MEKVQTMTKQKWWKKRLGEVDRRELDHRISWWNMALGEEPSPRALLTTLANACVYLPCTRTHTLQSASRLPSQHKECRFSKHLNELTDGHAEHNNYHILPSNAHLCHILSSWGQPLWTRICDAPAKSLYSKLKVLANKLSPQRLWTRSLMSVQASLKCGSPQSPSAWTTEAHDHIGGAIVRLFYQTYSATTDSTKSMFRPRRAASHTINARLQFANCLHLPSNPQVWTMLARMAETT